MNPVFVDTNIFIYASGDAHAYKTPSGNFLEKAANNQIKAVSNVEVLQEILHRSWFIKEKSRGFLLVEKIIEIIPFILPVSKVDILTSKVLLEKYSHIEARDAVHAATMLNHGIRTICSYDKHYDQIEEVERIEPR